MTLGCTQTLGNVRRGAYKRPLIGSFVCDFVILEFSFGKVENFVVYASAVKVRNLYCCPKKQYFYLQTFGSFGCFVQVNLCVLYVSRCLGFGIKCYYVFVAVFGVTVVEIVRREGEFFGILIFLGRCGTMNFYFFPFVVHLVIVFAVAPCAVSRFEKTFLFAFHAYGAGCLVKPHQINGVAKRGTLCAVNGLVCRVEQLSCRFGVDRVVGSCVRRY